MSYWGATVITSLVTTIPVIGQPILFWLCGAYTVDNPTLNRFYSLHYLLPFVLAGLSILHIAALHQYGSSNPIGINTASSVIPFSTYFGLKDLIGVLVLAMVYISLICFEPELLGHTDNLIPANPYVTPKHIQPEWYFLWFYAILRSIPSKALGVIAIALVFTSLMVLPYICLPAIGSPKYRVISERLHWFFVANLGLLTYIGACDITPTSTLAGQLCSLALFGYILVVMPLVGWFESMVYRHARS